MAHHEAEAMAMPKSQEATVIHTEEHLPADDELHEKVFTWPLVIAITSLSFSFVISLAIFLLAAPVLSNINLDLGPDASYTWIASAYTVSYAVASALYGSLADVFGRRWFAISAGGFVALGSLVAALAQNVNTVIAGMAVMGFGGAGGIQCVSAMSEIVPTRWRGPVVGVIEVPFFIFTCAGSWFSHRMITSTGPGWRSIFWIGVGSGAALAIGVFFTYRPEAPLASRGKSSRQIIRDFDYLGFVGLSVGVVLILVGIIYVPRYGSTSARFLAPLIVGFVVLVATGFQQVYQAKNPILHPYLWRRFRTFTLQAVVIFVSGMLFYSLQSLYPLFMSTCFVGNDPERLGVVQMPLGVSTIGGITSGVALPILSKYIGTNWVLGLGVLECSLFIALLAVADVHQESVAIGLASAATFGIGWTNLLSIPLMQLCAPDEWIGFATGLRTLMSLTGGSAATAIFSTIYASKAKIIIPQEVSAAAIAEGLPVDSVASLLGVLSGAAPNLSLTDIPGINDEIVAASTLALRRANIMAFRYVWYASIPFGVVALIAALFTRDLYPVMSLKIAQRLKTSNTVDAEVGDKTKEASQ